MLLALPATLHTETHTYIHISYADHSYPTLPYPNLSGSILRYSLSAVEVLTMTGP